MKPLTIEQLKALEVGDWVWIKDNLGEKYWRVYSNEGKHLLILASDCITDRFLYSDYGKTWLAYKNKEQAETKGDIVEIKGTCEHCIHNMQIGCYNNGINRPTCEHMRLYMKADDFCSKFEAERRLAELTKE